MVISILAAIAVFATLVVVHEAGHFVVAKRMGVRVLRFSIGYPPRIAGIRSGETDYAIGATPLGGYVRMLGDEIGDDPSPATVELYLKELQLDILGAAKKSGWLQESGKDGDDALLVIAQQVGASAGVAQQIEASAGVAQQTGASAAVAQQIGSSDSQGSPVAVAQRILGREPKADEAILLREVDRANSVKRAIETLSATRPSSLLELFKAQAFPSQPLRKRFAIVLAGPVANILFAPLMMTVILMNGVPTLLPVIGSVKKDLPAAAAGLRPGDRVMQVGQERLEAWEDLSTRVKGSDGKPLLIVVQRPDGNRVTTITLTITPQRVEEEAIYGKAPTWVIGVTPRGDEYKRKIPPLPALLNGFTQTARMTVTLAIGIAKIVDGTTPARQALGGPIMIAQIAGREVRAGFADIALFTVMLSLELGIINLLPVPLLDGGHLLFFVFEGVRGKPLKLRHREIAMEVGLFLLVILMAFVILNDISRLIG
jgi:regulator of sigma E protease